MGSETVVGAYRAVKCFLGWVGLRWWWCAAAAGCGVLTASGSAVDPVLSLFLPNCLYAHVYTFLLVCSFVIFSDVRGWSIPLGDG